MGSCCSLFSISVTSLQVVLKLPRGDKCIKYHNAGFNAIGSIQDWIQTVYTIDWSGWIAYNDETQLTSKRTKGHCKGILTWNASKIGWLIHSVPNFPTELSATTISPILPSELMYGQSFVYIEMKYTKEKLEKILQQIHWMDANIYLKHNMPEIQLYNSTIQIKKINISSTLSHHCKKHHHTIDIYGDYLCTLDNSKWYVETWRRGSPIVKKTNVYDIHNLGWNFIFYKESQDHSKWAVCKKYVWIGDLNRMESQLKRGGGGILIRNSKMVKAFKSLIIN